MDDSPQNRRRFWKRFARETQAGPIVEFAIIVPVLLLLLLGIVEFARAYFLRNTVVAGVRDAGRMLSVAKNPCDATTQAQARGRVRSYFVRSKPESTSTSIPIIVYDVGGTAMNCGAWSATSVAGSIKIAVANYRDTTGFTGFKPFRGSNILVMDSVKATFRWERAP